MAGHRFSTEMEVPTQIKLRMISDEIFDFLPRFSPWKSTSPKNTPRNMILDEQGT